MICKCISMSSVKWLQRCQTPEERLVLACGGHNCTHCNVCGVNVMKISDVLLTTGCLLAVLAAKACLHTNPACCGLLMQDVAIMLNEPNPSMLDGQPNKLSDHKHVMSMIPWLCGVSVLVAIHLLEALYSFQDVGSARCQTHQQSNETPHMSNYLYLPGMHHMQNLQDARRSVHVASAALIPRIHRSSFQEHVCVEFTHCYITVLTILIHVLCSPAPKCTRSYEALSRWTKPAAWCGDNMTLLQDLSKHIPRGFAGEAHPDIGSILTTIHTETHLLEGVLQDCCILLVEENEFLHLLVTLGLKTQTKSRLILIAWLIDCHAMVRQQAWIPPLHLCFMQASLLPAPSSSLLPLCLHFKASTNSRSHPCGVQQTAT